MSVWLKLNNKNETVPNCACQGALVPTDFFQSFFINSINAEKVATRGAG